MNWNTYLLSSPPQPKALLHDLSTSLHLRTQHKNSTHTKKPLPDLSPLDKHLNTSISALFLRQMHEEERNTGKAREEGKYHREVLEILLEMRKMQGEQLECQRRALKILEEQQASESRTNKKSSTFTNNTLEKTQKKSKNKQKIKHDLGLFLHKSKSTTKTQRKSHSLLRYPF